MPKLAPFGKFPSFETIFKLALRRQLDIDEIRSELHRQVDAFENELGRLPDFIDGHEHVQQLPIIRDALIDVVQKRFKTGTCWIRVAWTSPVEIFKRRYEIVRSIGFALAGLKLRNKAISYKIPVNNGLGGVYDFSSTELYCNVMKKSLQHGSERLLIITHPGMIDPMLTEIDGVSTAREWEMKYLLSDEFLKTLQEFGLKTGRFFK
jgi:hypothetical protein